VTTLHLLATRGVCLKSKRTDQPDIVLCLHSIRIDPRCCITDLSNNINSLGETTLELDSHADTCVFGRDAFIFLGYDRPVVVKGYDPSLGT
jgi:hypothetical protein